jgi:3-oxoacyl-[acyl-carrier-protein] synthase-3
MNIRIKDIGIYHPSNIITNDEIIKHYDEQNIDVRDFLKRAGRDRRYISNDKNENALTMAVNSSRNVLEKLNMHPSEIDMIVFVSDTPEYLVPSNALMIHNELKCRSDISVFDMNSNCVGMVNALDVISKMMLVDKSLNNVLIVGSQQLHHYGDSQGIYAIFGDLSCATVLEKTDDEKSYIIDSQSFTKSSLWDKMVFPSNGLSNLTDKPDSDWVRDYSDKAFSSAISTIETLLNRNGFKKSDVKKYFTSQMMKESIEKLADDLNEPLDKFAYIGNIYGYTGCTSPFLALYSSMKKGELQRGDLIVMWGIGCGATAKGVLLKI